MPPIRVDDDTLQQLTLDELRAATCVDDVIAGLDGCPCFHFRVGQETRVAGCCWRVCSEHPHVCCLHADGPDAEEVTRLLKPLLDAAGWMSGDHDDWVAVVMAPDRWWWD